MKKMIRIGFVILALAGAVLFVMRRGSPPDYSHTFDDPTKADAYSSIAIAGLEQDVDALVAYVEEVHPDPYRLISRREFLEHAAGLKQELASLPSADIVRLDCYYLFQKLIATLQDEHTSVVFHADWNGQIQDRFPVELVIDGSRAFVSRAHKAGIPRGAEVLSINGQAIPGLLDRARELVNQTLPHYKDQVVAENLALWLPTYLDLPAPWTVAHSRDGQTSVMVIPAAAGSPVESTGEYALYSESEILVRGEAVPVMTIPKFYYPNREDYDEFVHDFFVRHEDAGSIIIDLRDNPGGDGRWGRHLLDYLIGEPYVQHRKFDFKISQPFVDLTYFYADYDAYERGIPLIMRRWPIFRNEDDYWLEKATAAEIGEYVEDHDAMRDVAADQLVFSGDVYLLISHRTNSAAVVFAAIFQSRDVGVIVGRETGGRTSFTSDPIVVELPNSHLRLSLPVAILDLPGGTPEHGVIPDVTVPRNAFETDPDRDLDLEVVADLIENAG